MIPYKGSANALLLKVMNTHMPSLWKNQYSSTMRMFTIIRNKCCYAYLYFNRPGKVADIHIKCDVRIASEVKFFVGKAISVFLYI